jgi:hypothetical protein
VHHFGEGPLVLGQQEPPLVLGQQEPPLVQQVELYYL